MARISRWRAAPASPRSSAKPELMIIAARTPRSPHALSTSGTTGAGTVISARSMPAGNSFTDG